MAGPAITSSQNPFQSSTSDRTTESTATGLKPRRKSIAFRDEIPKRNVLPFTPVTPSLLGCCRSVSAADGGAEDGFRDHSTEICGSVVETRRSRRKRRKSWKVIDAERSEEMVEMGDGDEGVEVGDGEGDIEGRSLWVEDEVEKRRWVIKEEDGQAETGHNESASMIADNISLVREAGISPSTLASPSSPAVEQTGSDIPEVPSGPTQSSHAVDLGADAARDFILTGPPAADHLISHDGSPFGRQQHYHQRPNHFDQCHKNSYTAPIPLDPVFHLDLWLVNLSRRAHSSEFLNLLHWMVETRKENFVPRPVLVPVGWCSPPIKSSIENLKGKVMMPDGREGENAIGSGSGFGLGSDDVVTSIASGKSSSTGTDANTVTDLATVQNIGGNTVRRCEWEDVRENETQDSKYRQNLDRWKTMVNSMTDQDIADLLKLGGKPLWMVVPTESPDSSRRTCVGGGDCCARDANDKRLTEVVQRQIWTPCAFRPLKTLPFLSRSSTTLSPSPGSHAGSLSSSFGVGDDGTQRAEQTENQYHCHTANNDHVARDWHVFTTTHYGLRRDGITGLLRPLGVSGATHWDFVVQDTRILAAKVRDERRDKISLLKVLAEWAKALWGRWKKERGVFGRVVGGTKNESQELRVRFGGISPEEGEFWVLRTRWVACRERGRVVRWNWRMRRVGLGYRRVKVCDDEKSANGEFDEAAERQSCVGEGLAEDVRMRSLAVDCGQAQTDGNRTKHTVADVQTRHERMRAAQSRKCETPQPEVLLMDEQELQRTLRACSAV